MLEKSSFLSCAMLSAGWNVNPEDAAAFAAAQQVVAAEQARAAREAQRRDHQD